jgi:hypothetical protein
MKACGYKKVLALRTAEETACCHGSAILTLKGSYQLTLIRPFIQDTLNLAYPLICFNEV